MVEAVVYSSEELKRIQQIELETLKIIIDICQKNDIEWFLIGGSALGAVRHSGFIPWDDDIDVGMTRKNFERFLEVAASALPNGYILQSPYEKNAPYYYAKIKVDGTQFVEYCTRKLKIHQGVYVDIFPFDEVPDDENENEKQFEKFQKLIRWFSLRQIPDVSHAPYGLKACALAGLRRCAHIFARLLPHKTLIKKLDKCMTAWNGKGQAAYACLNFPVRKTEYILKDDLYPLRDWKFEELSIKIPNNYDTYLKTHYGDYMQLPPEEKRFGHKPFFVDLKE